jgi:hypothetical protein
LEGRFQVSGVRVQGSGFSFLLQAFDLPLVALLKGEKRE